MCPTPFSYSLQRLHGQFSGYQDLIDSLNFSRLSHNLIWSGSIWFQTMGPKLLNEFSPLFTVLTFGLQKTGTFFLLGSTIKISFMKEGDKSFSYLFLLQIWKCSVTLAPRLVIFYPIWYHKFNILLGKILLFIRNWVLQRRKISKLGGIFSKIQETTFISE